MTGINILAAFFIAGLFSYLVTPFMIKLAFKINFLDQPSDKKVHVKPTPLLGGLTIYFAFILAISLAVQSNEILIGMLIGGTVLMVIGIIDDKFGMMPKFKLLGQIIAAFIAINMGLKVSFIKIPFYSKCFTFLWLIGITNAFNLLDNINGLSAGIAAISAFFFGILAFYHGDIMIAVVCFALMGACLGFLKYNFRGKIFMGDVGSLFLGFMLASIAVWGSWKTTSVTTSLAIPILILAYPIFDMTFVVITRLLRGDPLSRGGKDHSSHRLAQATMEAIRNLKDRKKLSSPLGIKILFLTTREFIRGLKKKGGDRSSHRLAILGFKKKRAVLILYAVSFVLGLAALWMTVAGQYLDLAIMVISFILLVIFGIRLGKVRIKYKS